MKLFQYIVLLWLVPACLCLGGCGTQTINTQTLTFAPEPVADETPAPELTFLVTGGTVTNFTFTAGPGFNGVVPPVSAASPLGGTVITASQDKNQANLSLSETTTTGASVNLRSLSFGVLARANQLVVGQTYVLIQAPDAPGGYVSLVDSTSQGGVNTIHQSWAQSANTTGTVTLTDLTETTVELDFTFVNVEPDGVTPGSAAGSFAVSGHVLGHLVSL